MNPKVDFYFDEARTWKEEIARLRQLILSCGLEEELKWGKPCYTHQGRNIVLIHTFKDYCAMLFFKGALLNDPYSVLIQQTKNVQAARQIRFTNAKEINSKIAVFKQYVHEAIEVEKAGLKVAMKKTSAFSMPDEFKKVLAKKAPLKKAFEALTPGRQRAYLLYFSSAKQSATREARIKKYIPQIMERKGLND